MQESLDPVTRIVLGCLTFVVLSLALMFPVKGDHDKRAGKARDADSHSSHE